MILLLAVAFTALCVAASVRRLAFVVEATPIDDGLLATRLRASNAGTVLHASVRLARALESDERLDWERSVAAALGERSDVRAALLGEAMTELDFRTRRWLRVPRVCASLASSFGFLLATVALRVGLADMAGSGAPDEVVAVNSAVLDAIDVAAVGLVGAAFCIAVQYRARSALAARLSGALRLVETLEAIDGAGPMDGSGARGTVPVPEPGAGSAVSRTV